MFQTPILFLVFNRPETTTLVFEKIRVLKPKQLYIAADGPRSMMTGEEQQCDEVKRIVARVDWPCEINHLYRTENLGCKLAVSSAITWFFEHVEKGIILEDDCLPSQRFFHFCEQMLTLYDDNPNIWHISGNNFQDGVRRTSNSHYFSKYTHIWGWATWRRAWKHYEVDMKSFPDWSASGEYMRLLGSNAEKNFWLKKFKVCYEHPTKLTTWDYQWLFTTWLHKGICVNPEVNLVKNIGMGSGTHTVKSIHKFIIEPQETDIADLYISEPKIDDAADSYAFQNYLSFKGNFIERIRYAMSQMMKQL